MPVRSFWVHMRGGGQFLLDLSECLRFPIPSGSGANSLILFFHQPSSRWVSLEFWPESPNWAGGRAVEVFRDCDQILGEDSLESYQCFSIDEIEARLTFKYAGISWPLLEPIPSWDRTTRQLRCGGVLCREYTREAANQFAVLDAFEAAEWPKMIDSPFPGNVSRLREAIGDLNEKLRPESPIRFRGSARPEWYIVPSPAKSS